MTSRAMTDLQDRLAGAVWGHLVGDAMGVPYEFLPPDAIGEVRWGQSGTHSQPPGTWSDDGGLMLALLDSLLSAGFDPEDQGRRALRWLDGPDYKPGDLFDIGGTTAAALERIRAGVPAERAGGHDEQDNGNGSLMRVLPVALVGCRYAPATLVDWACRASCMTHAHPRSQAVCAVYCLLVRRVLLGAEDRHEALRLALLDAATNLPGDVGRELAEVRSYPHRHGTGYVLDTLWSAWDAFAAGDSYADVIVRAIRYGNDSDTTACVAGSLAGSLWGLASIPPAWLSDMREVAIAEQLVQRLQALIG